MSIRQKKIVFVSCNSLEKNMVGRSIKKKIALFYWSKICVLCMFYVDSELVGRKKL